MSRYRRKSVSRQEKSPLLKRLAFIVALLAGVSVLPVLVFRSLPPPITAFMLHAHVIDWLDGNAFRAVDYRWVDEDSISHYAFGAVVASEDQRFYRHRGFDLEAIFQAYRHYQHGGKLRGASTISQQVAKNLFLSPSRHVVRKLAELWFTFWIETLWSKRRILEVYLNVAEFGDHLFGIEAASRRYFGVPAKQLTARQAALLAATLPNPLKLKAANPSAYVLNRQRWILGQMHNLGVD